MGGEKDPVLPDPLPKPDARFLKIVSEYDLRFEVFDLGPEDVTRPAMAAGKCHLDARDAGCRLPRASFPRGDTVFTRPCPLHSLVVEVYLDGIVAECPQTARVEIRDPEERGVAGGELLVVRCRDQVWLTTVQVLEEVVVITVDDEDAHRCGSAVHLR